MLLTTGKRAVGLVRQAILPTPFPGISSYLRRLGLMAALLPVLFVTQLINGVGLLLDEILFPGYRRVAIRQPVLVLGVPRSGTTFMHRLLAADPGCTTFSTWECLFAPSIVQRRFWHRLAAVDSLIGRPCGRLLAALERRMLAHTGGVHPTGLFEPEEDYWCFMPVLCCFILVLPFPEADWLWRMARFDRDMPARERARHLRWYRNCLRRHLYFHGEDKRLVSKNASFAGMAASLVEEFPDCRLVICERERESVIRSQFRSLEGAMRWCAIARDDQRFRERLLGCIDFYYANLERAAAALEPERLVRVPLERLSADPRGIVREIGRRFGFGPARAVDGVIAANEAERGLTSA